MSEWRRSKSAVQKEFAHLAAIEISPFRDKWYKGYTLIVQEERWKRNLRVWPPSRSPFRDTWYKGYTYTDMDDLNDEMLAEYEARFILDGLIPEDEERRLPRHFDHNGHLPTWMTRSLARWGFQRTSESRFLTMPEMSLKSTAPLRSLPHGDWKMRTHFTSATSRSLTACMPEPGDWPWTPAWQTRGRLGCLLDFQKVRSFWNSSSCGNMLKVIGFSKTSLTQSVWRERRDRPSLRSLGTQNLEYWLESTVRSIRKPTLSLAVAYGLYPVRASNPANLAPLKDGDLNCVAQRVVGALWGRFERPGTYTRTAKENTWMGGESSRDWCHGGQCRRAGKDPQVGDHPEGHCWWKTYTTAENTSTVDGKP